MAGNEHSAGRFGTRLLRGCLAATSIAIILALPALIAGPSLAAAAATKKIKPILEAPPKGSKVNVVADKITYDARTKIAVATGKVQLTYGRYVLVATRVTYDLKRDIMTANGSVNLKEPSGNVLEADEAQLRDKFKEGFARHLKLLLTNDATITADYAVRSQGYLTTYEKVTYTRCKTCVLADGTPLWQLKSPEVKHDEHEHSIHYRDPTLELAGLPVFWLPELTTPDPTVKRRTGFLGPNFSYTSVYGAGVEVPYFFALAPNYDLTLRPVVTTDQGVLGRAVWRHRLASGQYDVDAAGIYQLDTNQDPPGDRPWRGAVRTKGKFEINKDWQWGWDGTLVSDRSFLQRYDLDNRDEAVDQIYLTGIHDRNYMSAQMLHFQSLRSDDSQTDIPYAVPYMHDSYQFGQPIFGGELGLDTSVYSLHRDDPIIPFDDVALAQDQSRGVVDVHWQRQMITGMGQVITPFARMRGDLYYTHDLPDPAIPHLVVEDETTARAMPQAGLDLRWPFIGTSGLGQHIVTPVAQVITATDESGEDKISNEDAITLNFDASSLFLHDRFTGLDRVEAGTRANVGMLYTLLRPNGGFARVSLGESFHLAGENSFVHGSGLQDNSSDLVAAIALQPTDYLRFSYQTRMSEDLSAIRMQQASLSLTLNRISASLNYMDVDAEPAYGRPDPEEQVWGLAGVNVWGGWSVFGGARYDLENSRMIKHLVGIGYECDCMNVRLYYKQDYGHDPEDNTGTSVMLSVELTTLFGSEPSQPSL